MESQVGTSEKLEKEKVNLRVEHCKSWLWTIYTETQFTSQDGLLHNYEKRGNLNMSQNLSGHLKWVKNKGIFEKYCFSMGV